MRGPTCAHVVMRRQILLASPAKQDARVRSPKATTQGDSSFLLPAAGVAPTNVWADSHDDLRQGEGKERGPEWNHGGAAATGCFFGGGRGVAGSLAGPAPRPSGGPKSLVPERGAAAGAGPDRLQFSCRLRLGPAGVDPCRPVRRDVGRPGSLAALLTNGISNREAT
jgi:hypothetical protein